MRPRCMAPALSTLSSSAMHWPPVSSRAAAIARNIVFIISSAKVVMRGLVPRISLRLARQRLPYRDDRDEPGHLKEARLIEIIAARSHHPGRVRIFRRNDRDLDLDGDILIDGHGGARSFISDLPDREVIGAFRHRDLRHPG